MPSSRLSDRRILAVRGPDAIPFLQGLVSNDITACAEGKAVYALLCNPQGKFLFEMFCLPDTEGLRLDIPTEDAEGLLRQLTLYRLRRQIRFEWLEETVIAGWDETPPPGAFPDPRFAGMGWRMVIPREKSSLYPDHPEAYDQHRIRHGIPAPGRELIPQKTLLLEAGLDRLNAIDFQKGCYVGQEVTTRSKFRGAVRRGLALCSVVEGGIHPGDSLLQGDKTVGDIRSVRGKEAIASVRNEFWAEGVCEAAATTAQGAAVTLRPPGWASGNIA